MKTTKIQNKGQATIFSNKYLEKLTKSHPAAIYVMYLPLIAYLLYYSGTSIGLGWGKVALLFFGGLAFWTLFEYLAHRYLFHTQAERPVAKRVAYILHGNHHEFPRDKDRLLLPPVPSLLVAGSIFAIMYLLMRQYAFAFFPGFILGYLLYGALHYAIHAMAPPFPWMQVLWRNHHLHHYKDDDHGFGVSSMFWDYVFGTQFDLSKNKEDRERVKELMFEG